MSSSTPIVRPLVRLTVTGRPVPEVEPPYDDVPAPPSAPRPTPPVTSGSLALAGPAWRVLPDAPARVPLHLVPASERPSPDQGDSGRELAEVASPVASLGVAVAGVDDVFDVVHTARRALPPPGPRAAVLIRAILETVRGDRPATQLMRWTTPAVYADIESAVDAAAARSWAATIRRLIVSEPADGVAEVAAVVQQGVRATALAMRLEGLDGRWVVTALQVG